MSANASAQDDSTVPHFTIVDTLRYPRHVRMAIIVGCSAALWAIIIAGGWGLWNLIA